MAGEVLVGRTAELSRMTTAAAEAVGGTGGALVVVGPAGIGKTSLLTEFRRSHQHLRCLGVTGVEVERSLAFAGLATLLTQADHTVAHLPPTTRDVILGAIGAAERHPVGLEAHQALLEFFGALGTDEPTVVIVDDAQWVDAATLGMLGFVARRIGNDRVTVVFATRPDDGVRRTLDGIETLTLAPLDAGDGRLLLTTRDVHPQVASACWSAAAGNPLAMIELADAISPDQRAGRAALPETLPPAESVRRDLAARLVEVTGPARTALAVVAVEGRGDIAVIARALAGLAVPVDALDPAFDFGLLHREGASVMWRHPLARSAVLAEIPLTDQRAAHRAVADVLAPEDAGRIAHHLSRAATGCDDDLADRLARIAEDAGARGASASAAQVWDAAADLTSDEGVRFDRRLAAIAAQWLLGDSEGTVRAADTLAAAQHDPVRRARAALLAGQASTWWDGPMLGARRLRDEATLVAPTSPAQAAMLSAFASNSAMMGLSPQWVIDDAVRTREWAVAGEDPGLAVIADAMECLGRLLAGDAGRARELLAPLPELSRLGIEHRVPGADVMVQVVATCLTITEDWDEAAGLLVDLIAWCRATGHAGMEVYAADQLTDLEWHRGRWEDITGRIARMETLAPGGEQPVVHQFRLRAARLAAARGHFDRATVVAEQALSIGLDRGLQSVVIWARETLALVARGRGDDRSAVRQYDALAVLHDDRGVRGPSPVLWRTAHAELLVADGRTADAARARRRVAEQHTRHPSHASSAALAHADAALSSDPAHAAHRLSEAITSWESLGAPFEAALSRLRRAEVLVAAGNAAEARDDLTSALQHFDHLGAQPWSERTLALLDIRPDLPRHVPLSARLSDAELRVARAIASGLTNQQAAQELFLSAHTVNSHLRAIYQRLDINTRSQLGALVARDDA